MNRVYCYQSLVLKEQKAICKEADGYSEVAPNFYFFEECPASNEVLPKLRFKSSLPSSNDVLSEHWIG